MRIDGRQNLEFRKMDFHVDYLKIPFSCVKGVLGDTVVLVSVTLTDALPDFCKGLGHGWITAEYRMLPASTITRNPNIVNARAQEIRRIVSRVLRSAFDLYKFPKYQLIVDCDVLQADGGTRIACINTGFVALLVAFNKLLQQGAIECIPLKSVIAAMSFVIQDGQILLDPNYIEDSSADVDLNIVVTADNKISELQFSSEKDFMNPELLSEIIQISFQKSREIIDIYRSKLGGVLLDKIF
ncbi:MAG: ribonuclease PH [bacterium]